MPSKDPVKRTSSIKSRMRVAIKRYCAHHNMDATQMTVTGHREGNRIEVKIMIRDNLFRCCRSAEEAIRWLNKECDET